MQVPLNDEAANGTNDEQDKFRMDALAVRLLLVLTGSSTCPAASGQEKEVADFYLDHLLAVHLAVERVWQTRKPDLPTETGLKQKTYAWLANDLVRDKFLPSEAAEKLGKAMQTRVGALRGEVRSLRDRSGAERRAAERAAGRELTPKVTLEISQRLNAKSGACTNKFTSPMPKLATTRQSPSPRAGGLTSCPPDSPPTPPPTPPPPPTYQQRPALRHPPFLSRLHVCGLEWI